jgi:glyoxylase-like metal-dependent hydrolase (beta-lactamase superfamily II)
MVFPCGDKEKKIPITFCIYLICTDGRNILVDAGCTVMPGFQMQCFFSPAFVLRQVGLSAEDITDVVITHGHHDHAEAVRYFRNAVIHTTRAAYAEAAPYIPADFAVSFFEGEYVPAPQIRVVEWGGHAAGSCFVEIQAEDAVHILAGDECYTNANLERNIPTGTAVDREKAAAFVEKFRKPPYRVHTCHDASLVTEKIV